MSNGWLTALAPVLAYLLGSVMGGDLMRMLLGGADLRSAGSGNVGTTNALRTRGPLFAFGVLLIDFGKGAVAAGLLPRLAPQHDWLPYACGAAVALGHCFPPQHGLRGGKGVATLGGAFVVLAPSLLLAMLAVFALAVLLFGYVSLASLAAAATAAGGGLLALYRAPSLAAFCLAMVLLTLYTHRDNLRRLLAGRESRFERARLLGRWLERRFKSSGH
ncbi:MAG: glycerol-3-phosphate 1-O-acyltransferase PlsY [Gammaproteobacteria bacterium]|nr:glycerol-3-phosphate 1-O-acyltransferase PlsY [Gammaproteobacteria bacterium]